MRRKDQITFTLESIQFNNVVFKGISVIGPKVDVLNTIDYLLGFAERYSAVRGK